MKLFSLNTAGATQGLIFYEYIQSLKDEVDIFCFQEVFNSDFSGKHSNKRGDVAMYTKLNRILPDFFGFFLKRSKGRDFFDKVDFEVEYGLAMFVKKNIKIISFDSYFIIPSSKIQYPVEGDINCQTTICSINGFNMLIINYHGPAMPGDKLDTEERILASEKLKQIWTNAKSDFKILCGDFNLMPETQSIKILDELSVNLVKQFSILNTRNEISWKKFKNKQNFADYCFVSKNLKVNSFEVPYNLVSDHLPMMLDFNISNLI